MYTRDIYRVLILSALLFFGGCGKSNDIQGEWRLVDGSTQFPVERLAFTDEQFVSIYDSNGKKYPGTYTVNDEQLKVVALVGEKKQTIVDGQIKISDGLLTIATAGSLVKFASEKNRTSQGAASQSNSNASLILGNGPASAKHESVPNVYRGDGSGAVNALNIIPDQFRGYWTDEKSCKNQDEADQYMGDMDGITITSTTIDRFEHACELRLVIESSQTAFLGEFTCNIEGTEEIEKVRLARDGRFITVDETATLPKCDTADAMEAIGADVATTSAPPGAVDRQTDGPLMTKGKNIYESHCAACHKPDGSGMPPTFPSIRGSKVVNGQLAMHLSLIIKGKGGMPPFGSLSNEQIAAVATYQRNALGNSVGTVVQPADVRAAR